MVFVVLSSLSSYPWSTGEDGREVEERSRSISWSGQVGSSTSQYQPRYSPYRIVYILFNVMGEMGSSSKCFLVIYLFPLHLSALLESVLIVYCWDFGVEILVNWLKTRKILKVLRVKEYFSRDYFPGYTLF